MVKGSAGSAEKSGFELELGALAEAISGEEGLGAEVAEVVSGSFAVPLDASFQQNAQTFDLEIGAGEQIVLPDIDGEPEGQAPLPSNASNSSPTSPVAAARPESVAPPTGEAAGVAAVSPAPAPSAPVNMPSGPAVEAVTGAPVVLRPAAAGEGQAIADVKGQAAVEARPAGAVPAEIVIADAPRSGEGAQNLSGKVILPVAAEPGSVIDQEQVQPLLKTVVGETQRALNVSPDVVPAGESNRSVIAVVPDETVAPQKPVVADKAVVVPVQQVERRWQVELPSELRAPALSVASPTSNADQQQSVLPVSVDAKVQVPSNPGSQVENARSAALTLAEAAPASINEERPAAKLGQAVASQRAVPDVAVASAQSSQSLPSQSSATEPAVPGTVEKPVVEAAQVRAAPQPSNVAVGQKVVAQVSPEAFAVVEESLSDPDLAEEPAAPRTNAVSGSVETPAKTAGNTGNPVGVEQAAKPVSGGPEVKPAGGTPLAAAFLASQLVAEELQSAGQSLEGSFAGETGTTVRGGDGAGAMRTESLQAPTQAQSGQVATQVAAEIARNLKNGQTRFQMRFDPPELGRVEVNMRVGTDGGVHAHLIVERPETLDMFLRDQRGLERALEAAGLNADPDNLQFSLKQEGGRDFASGDGQSDDSAQMDQGEDGAENDEDRRGDEDIVRLTLASQRGGLDLKI